MDKKQVTVTKNKRIFSVKLADGTETMVSVSKPDNEANKYAKQIYNRAFKDAIDSGAIVRAAISKVMREQNLWDDNQQKLADKLERVISDGEKALQKGGIPLSKAKEIALKMSEARAELQSLLRERNQLDLHTAESQATNEQFAALLVKCTRIEATGKLFFRDLVDYKDREADEEVLQIAEQFAKIYYGVEDDWQKKLPENAFLLKHKFVDEEMRYLNRKGEFVDRDGRRVDAEGWYINEKGVRVDSDGTPINEKGEPIVEFKEFIDDLDEVVVPAVQTHENTHKKDEQVIDLSKEAPV